MAGSLTVPTLFTSTAMSRPINTFEILLYTLSSAWKCQLQLSSPQRSILSLFLWLHLSTCPNFYLSERFLAPYVHPVLHILCLKHRWYDENIIRALQRKSHMHASPAISTTIHMIYYDFSYASSHISFWLDGQIKLISITCILTCRKKNIHDVK